MENGATQAIENKNTTFGEIRPGNGPEYRRIPPARDIPTRTDPLLGPVTVSRQHASSTHTGGQSTGVTSIQTIREWWIGSITSVRKDERYFEAQLRDLRGLTSVGEFDFDAVFEGYSDEEIAEHLFQGSEFIFYVVVNHGRGAPQTVSAVEWTSPYYWKEADFQKADDEYLRAFPDDPFEGK